MQNAAPCCSRDRTANQSGPPHCRFLVVIIIVGGLAGGERLRRRLPGVEAATEEAATAVIMTSFVVGCGRMLCFWFNGGVNYTLSVITRA